MIQDDERPSPRRGEVLIRVHLDGEGVFRRENAIFSSEHAADAVDLAPQTSTRHFGKEIHAQIATHIFCAVPQKILRPPGKFFRKPIMRRAGSLGMAVLYLRHPV
jgi:hypothetical protein